MAWDQTNVSGRSQFSFPPGLLYFGQSHLVKWITVVALGYVTCDVEMNTETNAGDIFWALSPTRKSPYRKTKRKIHLRFLQSVRKVAVLRQKVAFRNICLKGIGEIVRKQWCLDCAYISECAARLVIKRWSYTARQVLSKSAGLLQQRWVSSARAARHRHANVCAWCMFAQRNGAPA